MTWSAAPPNATRAATPQSGRLPRGRRRVVLRRGLRPGEAQPVATSPVNGGRSHDAAASAWSLSVVDLATIVGVRRTPSGRSPGGKGAVAGAHRSLRISPSRCVDVGDGDRTGRAGPGYAHTHATNDTTVASRGAPPRSHTATVTRRRPGAAGSRQAAARRPPWPTAPRRPRAHARSPPPRHTTRVARGRARAPRPR